MITTITLTFVLSVLFTILASNIVVKKFYNDYTRHLNCFKLIGLPYITVKNKYIDLLLSNGDVVEFTFDEKGLFISALPLE